MKITDLITNYTVVSLVSLPWPRLHARLELASMASIPGLPGTDYPVLSPQQLAHTDFSCHNKQFGGR